MAVIDIGGGDFTSHNNMISGYTFMDDVNRANASGSLDYMQFRVKSSTINGLKIGTFPLDTKVVRDYENLGDGFAVGLHTVTGLTCTVATDDVLGAYFTAGDMTLTSSGDVSTTEYYYHGNGFDGGSHSYSSQTYRAAMYATGTTVAAGSLPLKNVFNRPFSGVFR